MFSTEAPVGRALIARFYLAKSFIAIHLVEKKIEFWFIRNIINREIGFHKCEPSANCFERFFTFLRMLIET